MVEGLSSNGRGDGRILKTAYFLGNCTGTDNSQSRYIRGRLSYVCRTKRGRKTRALWRNCRYHKMRNAIAEVSQKKLSRSSRVQLYIQRHYYIWQPRVVTSWRLVYRIDVALIWEPTREMESQWDVRSATCQTKCRTCIRVTDIRMAVTQLVKALR